MTSPPLLLDTDFIIDHLRGRGEAIAFMRQLTQRPLTSVVVVAELYAGVRDGPERKQLDHFLTGVRIVSVDQEIAIEGGLYRRAFGKSHGVGLADALIAATAKKEHAHLVTSNQKHFPMLADVVVPYAKA